MYVFNYCPALERSLHIDLQQAPSSSCLPALPPWEPQPSVQGQPLALMCLIPDRCDPQWWRAPPVRLTLTTLTGTAAQSAALTASLLHTIIAVFLSNQGENHPEGPGEVNGLPAPSAPQLIARHYNVFSGCFPLSHLPTYRLSIWTARQFALSRYCSPHNSRWSWNSNVVRWRKDYPGDFGSSVIFL